MISPDDLPPPYAPLPELFTLEPLPPGVRVEITEWPAGWEDPGHEPVTIEIHAWPADLFSDAPTRTEQTPP